MHHQVVMVQGQAELLEVILAAGPVGRLADHLHGRDQQADEHAEDGDDHQQLDEGKPASGHDRASLATGQDSLAGKGMRK